MTVEPCSSHPVAEETHPSPLRRIVRFAVRLPFVIFSVVIRGLLYSAWYLAFYVLCMFRSFTGVMLPILIAVSGVIPARGEITL